MKLNMHHVYGVAFVALGALMSQQAILKEYMTDRTFGLVTVGIGVAVAVFGFLSGSKSNDS
ncbi:MAG: hypothetical protein ACRD0E_00105 [Acidimicrobiales bacterium]